MFLEKISLNLISTKERAEEMLLQYFDTVCSYLPQEAHCYVQTNARERVNKITGNIHKWIRF